VALGEAVEECSLALSPSGCSDGRYILALDLIRISRRMSAPTEAASTPVRTIPDVWVIVPSPHVFPTLVTVASLQPVRRGHSYTLRAIELDHKMPLSSALIQIID